MFLSVLSIVLFQVSFCKQKLWLKLGGSPFLKTNDIPARGHQFFQFFQRFFKVDAAFPYSGNDFTISFTRLVQMDFLPSGNSFFWVKTISLLVETIIRTRRKQFWEKELIIASEQLTVWLLESIFFFIFQRLLPVRVYFSSKGSVFFDEILHSD